ncbi:MAG: STAS domain-containing protein [Magnetococcus sp. MYC-9]
MIDFSLDDSGTSGTLMLSGSLTIQQAMPLKELLLRAVGEVNQLTINMEQVERLDLTALQLLCAAHRDLLKSGKQCVRQGTLPDALQRAVREAGFVGCAGEDDVMGLWTGASN